MDIILAIMSKFFKSDADRKLWIKLNAERIQYNFKVRNAKEKDVFDACLRISEKQLIYDENEYEAPRYSIEQLLTLSPKELYQLQSQQEQKIIDRIYKNDDEDVIDLL
jgi:hypothetical protein